MFNVLGVYFNTYSTTRNLGLVNSSFPLGDSVSYSVLYPALHIVVKSQVILLVMQLYRSVIADVKYILVCQ